MRAPAKTINQKTNSLITITYLTGMLCLTGTSFAAQDLNQTRAQQHLKVQQLEQSLDREREIQESVKEFEESRKANKLKAEKIKARDKITAKNCHAAKERLAGLRNTPRARIKSPNGESRVLSPEERTQEIESTEQAVKKYCVEID